MKIKIMLFITLLFLPISVNAYSYAAVVMDADSGRVLMKQNENERMLIASTTKIMTAVVALENARLDKKITIGPEVKEVYGSMTYIKEGEVFSLEDLLYGLMNRSGNDAAMSIAHSTASSYEDFIDKMNKTAIRIGMINTTFQNPHGLDDDTKNYSTAYDMALLMKYAMQNSDFRKISNNKKYKVTTDLDTYIWHNKNNLLGIYKYATGGKIGYTTHSRHVFVSAATKGNKNLVIATIKVTDRFNEHKNLYEKYFDMYEKYLVLNKYTFSIKEDYYKKYHLYIKNDVSVLLKDDEKDKVDVKIVLKKRKRFKNGDNVGYAAVFVNGREATREDIFIIESKSKQSKIKSLLSFWK